MIKVLGLGDNVCDVYLHTGIMYPGGQAVNFAVYAAGLGTQADYMGVFGADPVGDHVQNTLDEKGVGHTHCRVFPGENGFARVTLVEGDRVFKGSNRGGVLREHPIFLDENDRTYLSGFDLVHTTCNGFTDALLPGMKALPCLVSYDFSYRWSEADRVERTCPYIDLGFLSCSELSDEETETLCRSLNAKGCAVVVATRGSKGATVFDGAQFYRQPPHLVEAVDTMGAGDSFATAMMVSLLEAMEGADRKEKAAVRDTALLAQLLPAALDRAAEFSARTCLVSGAFGCGIPVPEELRERICNGVL